jgi:hypothetical protein
MTVDPHKAQLPSRFENNTCPLYPQMMPRQKRRESTGRTKARPTFNAALKGDILPVQPSLPVLIYRLQAVGSKRGSGLWGPAVQIQPRKKIYGRTRQKPIINLLQKSLPHLKEN